MLLVPAQAQLYKWVDDKGRTHYGERPPQGVSAREVEQRLANPAPAPGKTSQPDWKGRELEFRGRRIAHEQAEAKERERDERVRIACKQARDTLLGMKAAARTYRLNESGARVYQSDSERAAAIAQQEQLVTQRCS